MADEPTLLVDPPISFLPTPRGGVMIVFGDGSFGADLNRDRALKLAVAICFALGADANCLTATIEATKRLIAYDPPADARPS